MRYLKRQNINRRTPQSTTVYSDAADANVFINPRHSGSMALPIGTDAQIPSNPVNGMMRYNVDHKEVQVYQGGVGVGDGSWRSIRFKESTQITQQNLGSGDASTVYFGPLNPAPPIQVQSGATWGGQNIIVLIENVMQLNTTNYTVVQNPTFNGTSHTGYYLFFSSPPPFGKPVTALIGFDQ